MNEPDETRAMATAIQVGDIANPSPLAPIHEPQEVICDVHTHSTRARLSEQEILRRLWRIYAMALAAADRAE
jgi:hypothetical protein